MSDQDKNQGTIAVDLDGTLAEYHGWRGEDHIGAPIPAMKERVESWLLEGRRVVIFTARVSGGRDPGRIQEWLMEHIAGWHKIADITCVKDFSVVELWDDRAVQVEINTGKPLMAEIERLRADCRTLEMAAADANALAFQHEAVIERLRKVERELEAERRRDALDGQATLDERNNEIERLGDMVEDARLVIGRGVDLMTNEQVGRWEGVRTWLELEASDE